MTHVGTSYYQSMINTSLRRDKAETVISFVGVFMPHHCVIAWHIMFGKIIQFVGFSWNPLNKEVSLEGLIFDLIESHVH